MSVPGLQDAGFEPESECLLDSSAAARLAACLDAAPERLASDELPILWHWAYFLPDTPSRALGEDGHPRRRAEMDEFPRRMWIGGRITNTRPLRLDAPALRRTRLARSELKSGTHGSFWLLTVVHLIEQDHELCVTEEQDLALRARSPTPPPGPRGSDRPTASWVEERALDPALLFRFSAITFNAHRIHYDQAYATGIEGYPGLVVQAPLTSLLLAEFAVECSGAKPTMIVFRARTPLFASDPFWLTGTPAGTGMELAAIRSDLEPAMTVQASWNT